MKVLSTKKKTSTLIIACGIVAFSYLAYRIASLGLQTLLIEQAIADPRSNASIVCSKEEDSNLTDPAPLLSESYQKRVREQQALSPNLATNADLKQVDADQPTGFSHNVENAQVTYQRTTDTDGRLFLRATSLQPPSTQNVMPNWQFDPVRIGQYKTYAYNFWYRSDSPVDVTLEYTKDDGPHYSHIITLERTAEWRQMTAHFNNTESASTFRVLLTGTDAGNVDTRDYDIHQIPDASLRSGTVSVTFDDGWQSTKDMALKLLDKYKVRTTQYVISEVADSSTPEYMDIRTIKGLKKKGHEIGSHSQTHCNQTVLSNTDIENDARGSKSQLEQQELGPIDSFAYPLGQYNQETQSIYSKVYPLVRTSDAGYNDRYFDETSIRSMGILDKVTDDQFQEMLDHAKQHNLWLVLVYHRVDESGEYNVTHQQLEKQLQMITQSGLSIEPLSQAAHNIRQ